MSLLLETEKRYITLGGWVTPPMKFDGVSDTPFPFYVGATDVAFNGEDGNCAWDGHGSLGTGGPNQMNIIAEYHEPAPAVEAEQIREENTRLRAIFPKILEALESGGCTPEVSVEFMEAIPGEVKAVVKNLKRAQPAPAGWIMNRLPTEADGKEFVVMVKGRDFPGIRTLENHDIGLWRAWLPIPKFTPPPPEKKKVPLTLADIPMLSLLLDESLSNVPFAVLYRNAMSVFILNPHFDSNVEAIHYPELVERGIKISRDGGKSWEPCWKEVEA